MEILLFIILLILALVLATINIFLISKINLQNKEPIKEEKKPRLTKEEKEKQKQLREAFESLMNYDENIARSRK